MDTSQILPNLFVGSCRRSTEDIDHLKRDCGLTAVLNLQSDEDMAYLGLDWEQICAYYNKMGINTQRVPVRDFDRDDLRRQLPRCVAALDEMLKQGHTVFVHCSMGINRAPSTVIAYLWWVQKWDLEEAIDHVMNCRSCDPYIDVIRLAGTDFGGAMH
jgi:protein-tyrosine phosphatase